MSNYVDETEKVSFQHFMLTGKIISAEERLSDKQDGSSLSMNVSPCIQKRKSPFQKQAQLVQTAIDAFHKLFLTDWLSTDDQLYLLVESISNLRERIWIASRYSAQSQLNKSETLPWKHQGYRGAPTSLQEQDVDKSLEHSLLAHERMSASLRQGLSKLHQAQEGLARRLDEMLALMNSLLQMSVLEEKSDSLMFNPGQQVEECIQLSRAAAADLYQKQVFGQGLLDSANDTLLFSVNVNGTEEYSLTSNPRSVAYRAANKWSRTNNKASPFWTMGELINGIKLKMKELGH